VEIMPGIIDTMRRVMNPLKRRVLLMITRGFITAINDSKKLQFLQINLFAGEVRDNLERFQEYGFTSVPLPDAEAVAVFLGGNRDHGIIISTDDRRYRLTGLENGEVALYTDEGDFIKLKRNNEIEINSGSKITLNSTANVEINATTKVEINSAAVEINTAALDINKVP
jgi:phage baseplate assembly protein V